MNAARLPWMMSLVYCAVLSACTAPGEPAPQGARPGAAWQGAPERGQPVGGATRSGPPPRASEAVDQLSFAGDQAEPVPPLDHAARLRRRAAQEVNQPWLAGRALPLAREAALPARLLVNVDTHRLLAGRAATLAMFAPRLARLHGWAVRVLPDAELPAALFLPRLATRLASGQSAATKPSRLAAPSASASGAVLPLPQLLDELTAQWGVYWRHRGGAIEFYRTETRVFPLARPSLAAHTDIRYDSAKAWGRPQASVKTRMADMGASSLDNVRLRVESLLTRAGVATVQPGAEPTVIVTDIPPVLARVAAFLADGNRSATRRVRLVLEEIAWSAFQHCEGAVDWSALHRAAAGADGRTGAEAVIARLRSAGAILHRRSIPVVTLNHRPVTHVFHEMGANSGSARVAAQSVLTLLPDIQADGRILVSVAYDNSAAPAFANVAFGQAAGAPLDARVSAGAGQALAGAGTVQQLVLLPSQALIIAGHDEGADESTQACKGARPPRQASPAGASSLLILTASVEEGALASRGK